ncbi:MAG: bifunctional demethylmenaquinone methyltransferase/2-methoxy-6-polyprenyl-1,4-benzoquinol methylase UbiE [Verrucomicrobiales bacterium]|nr:bifunctional demethylmenaquinone methyltransferase/2-methoxy-6-polyprenyl-1,4-benzoquinol methylase UbiE [Verrucomicrobiales bacterium]
MQDPKDVKDAFAGIASRYAVTNHVLSLGVDILWRRKVAKMISRRIPINILDVATGSGDLALEIQKRCPKAEVIGSDFCEAMLQQANKRGLKRTVLADALNLPFPENRFDVVTVGFGLRNMADWSEALSEMFRVLSSGGCVVVLDFSLPESVVCRKLYRFYLHKILPAVAGLITGKRSAYQYLGRTIESFPSGKDMCSLIESSGFNHAKFHSLSGGIATIYSAEKN